MAFVWKARLLEADDTALQRGFDDAHRCLFCDAASDTAEAAAAHLAAAHGTPLTALLSLGKDFTGLTDTQKQLIGLWQGGATDAHIAAARGVSPSTLRNQRFALREREAKARLLLAILSLSGLSGLSARLPREKAKTASAFFDDGVSQFFKNGQLTTMPAREAKRLAVMQRFAALLTPGRCYDEAELKALFVPLWADHATVRRYLVDYGLLRRDKEGAAYWRPLPAAPALSLIPAPAKEEQTMSADKIDKKAAKLAYKSTITPMGIYRLLDTQTGKSVIAAERNLNSVMGRVRFLMNGAAPQPAGPFSDPAFYRDFNDHPDAFTFEVIDPVDTQKCATYEEAAALLETLAKAAPAKYADIPQYQYK